MVISLTYSVRPYGEQKQAKTNHATTLYAAWWVSKFKKKIFLGPLGMVVIEVAIIISLTQSHRRITENLTSQGKDYSTMNPRCTQPPPFNLIHRTHLQSRPLVITVFTRCVCPNFRQNFPKQNRVAVRIVITTG